MLLAVNLYDISKGEWVVIGIALATLIAAVWTAVITHKMWTAHKTDLELGDIVILNYPSTRQVDVSFKMTATPLAGGFVVMTALCELKQPIRRKLSAVTDNVGRLHASAVMLDFRYMGREIDLISGQLIEVKIDIRLQDKSHIVRTYKVNLQGSPES